MQIIARLLCVKNEDPDLFQGVELSFKNSARSEIIFGHARFAVVGPQNSEHDANEPSNAFHLALKKVKWLTHRQAD